MRTISILLLLTAIVMISQAEEVLQVELEWFNGGLQKVSEKVLAKKVKRSRSAARGGRSGAASS